MREELKNCWICGAKADHPGKRKINWDDSAWCSNKSCHNDQFWKIGKAKDWAINAERSAKREEKLAVAQSLLYRTFRGGCMTCVFRDSVRYKCTLLELMALTRGRRQDCPFNEFEEK